MTRPMSWTCSTKSQVPDNPENFSGLGMPFNSLRSRTSMLFSTFWWILSCWSIFAWNACDILAVACDCWLTDSCSACWSCCCPWANCWIICIRICWLPCCGPPPGGGSILLQLLPILLELKQFGSWYSLCCCWISELQLRYHAKIFWALIPMLG